MQNLPEELVICLESSDTGELYKEELLICQNYKSQKRINEFKRARLAAKKALKNLNINNFPILKAESGAPLWPENISGSISHSENLALVVVSNKHSLIGADIEFIKTNRNPQIFEKICTNNELFWAKENLNKRGLQIFSAKEAIYKAFFNLSKLGFNDVELNWKNDHFSCTLKREINAIYKKNFIFKCYQAQHPDYIISIVAL